MFRCVFILTLVLLGLFSGGIEIEGKQFYRCELSRELLNRQINKTFLSNWICLIEHESDRNTKKVTGTTTGVTKNGLFQISSKDACGMNSKGGLCNKKCEDFLNDNIDDDVECAKKIFDKIGFKYWQGWNSFCRDPRNLPNLAVACNIHTLSAYRGI